jgi:hypothetical protein
VQEKERDFVLMEIERDRLRQERDQALDDLQNVERSFRDIQRYANTHLPLFKGYR